MGILQTKKQNRNSYTTVCVNHNIRLEQGRLLLPKLKWIRVKQHREIPEHFLLKSVTVSRTPTGKYYASLLYEFEAEISSCTDIREEKVLGLDFSMKDLFVASNGTIRTEEESLHCYRKAQKRLEKEQRRLSHCKKGSQRYEKQRRFLSFLSYKLEEQGKKLIKIDRFFPSSKQCHICSYKKEKLELSERSWRCPECGTVHDRDYNASMNIKKEGMRLLIQSA